jgi:hypothetical protein
MRTDALSKDDYVVGGVALLLVIDLLFLPWYSVFGASVSATSNPHGWAGILAMIAALLVLVDLLIERLSPQTTLPNLGGSRATTRLYLAGIAAVFVVLKFLLDVHFGWFGIGFWAAVVLTVALVFATLRISQDRTILGGVSGTSV